MGDLAKITELASAGSTLTQNSPCEGRNQSQGSLFAPRSVRPRGVSTKLILGDSRQVLGDLQDSAQIDAVITDPPWGSWLSPEWDILKTEYAVESNNKPNGWKWGGRPGAVSARIYETGPKYQEWTKQWATEALRVIIPGGFLLAFSHPKTIASFNLGLEAAGWEIRDCISWEHSISWAKSRNCFQSTWEPIVVARKPGPFRLQRDNGLAPVNKIIHAKASRQEREEAGNHPACKPIGLLRQLIRLVTSPGETVLDPFAGSGSTLVAAVLENRSCIGIEKEAEYCTIAEARLSAVQYSTAEMH